MDILVLLGVFGGVAIGLALMAGGLPAAGVVVWGVTAVVTRIGFLLWDDQLAGL